MTTTLGTTLGSYELNEVIGRGAMGEVYKGARIGCADQMAVKILRPELVADPELVARFLQERTVLCSVSHPNLVCVHDLVIEGGSAAIVMDLVEGSDLRRQLNERGPSPAGDAVRIAASILAALGAVHSVGIVHRDIKPENVLVDDAGHIRVTDFGIARLTYGPSLTRLTGLIGTPEYLAPEVAEREHATPAADVYAAGILLHELLTGYTPFAGGHPVAVLRRHMEEVPARPEGVRDEVWTLIAAMLDKNPTRRPTATEAASRLFEMLPTLEGIAALPPTRRADDGTGYVISHTIQRGDAIKRSTDIEGRGEVVLAMDRRWAPKRITVLVLSLIVVVGAVAAIGWSLGKSDPTGSPKTSYAFPPQSFSSGLRADRTWSITGASGHRLLGKVRLTNGGKADLDTSYTEVIPTSVASRVQAISFRPRPAHIIKTDPVVGYTVYLAPGASRTIEYETQLPHFTGSDLAELRVLAKDQSTAQSAYLRPSTHASPLTLRSFSITPSPLTLQEGQSPTVAVSGVMSNGSPAPEAALTALSWSSCDPSVAVETPGSTAGEYTITGVYPGATTITAQAGSLTSQLAVTVLPGSTSTTGGPATHSVPSQSSSNGSAGSRGAPSVNQPAPSVATPAPSPVVTPAPTPVPSPTQTTIPKSTTATTYAKSTTATTYAKSTTSATSAKSTTATTYAKSTTSTTYAKSKK